MGEEAMWISDTCPGCNSKKRSRLFPSPGSRKIRLVDPLTFDLLLLNPSLTSPPSPSPPSTPHLPSPPEPSSPPSPPSSEFRRRVSAALTPRSPSPVSAIEGPQHKEVPSLVDPATPERLISGVELNSLLGPSTSTLDTDGRTTVTRISHRCECGVAREFYVVC